MKNSRLSFLVILGSALIALPALRAVDTPPATPPPPAGERREHRGEYAERMADELGLNADQKTKIEALMQQERAELQALSPDDRRTKGKEIRAKYREQRQAIMTPEQRAKADKMHERLEKRRERREDKDEKSAN
jgi:Spy/CpxP family protein refolding chaperone